MIVLRTTSLVPRFLLVLVGLVLGSQVGNASARPPERSVWDGVYSEEQATRGEALYQAECGSCRGPLLDGGEMAPPLACGFRCELGWIAGLELGRSHPDFDAAEHAGEPEPAGVRGHRRIHAQAQWFSSGVVGALRGSVRRHAGHSVQSQQAIAGGHAVTAPRCRGRRRLGPRPAGAQLASSAPQRPCVVETERLTPVSDDLGWKRFSARGRPPSPRTSTSY